MPLPLIIPLAVAAGVKAVGGYVESRKAKKKLDAANAKAAANIRPDYEIPFTEYENVDLLESRGSQGLSDSTLNAYNNNANRALTSSLDTILKSGGNSGDASKVYDSYSNNNFQIQVANEQAKLQNIAAMIAGRNRMSDQLDKQWQVNKYAPYVDTAVAAQEAGQQAAKQQSQGKEMMWSGISNLAGGMSNYLLNNNVSNATNSIINPQQGNAMGYNNIGLDSPNNSTYRDNMYGGIDWSKIKPDNRGTLFNIYKQGR